MDFATALWREGYATEVSFAWFDAAWTALGIDEIIGYTSANQHTFASLDGTDRYDASAGC